MKSSFPGTDYVHPYVDLRIVAFGHSYWNRYQTGKPGSAPYVDNADFARFNYILWIEELLDSTNKEYKDHYDSDRDVIGLDMYALFPWLLLPSSSIMTAGLAQAASIHF